MIIFIENDPWTPDSSITFIISGIAPWITWITLGNTADIEPVASMQIAVFELWLSIAT